MRGRVSELQSIKYSTGQFSALIEQVHRFVESGILPLESAKSVCYELFKTPIGSDAVVATNYYHELKRRAKSANLDEVFIH